MVIIKYESGIIFYVLLMKVLKSGLKKTTTCSSFMFGTKMVSSKTMHFLLGWDHTPLENGVGYPSQKKTIANPGWNRHIARFQDDRIQWHTKNYDHKHCQVRLGISAWPCLDILSRSSRISLEKEKKEKMKTIKLQCIHFDIFLVPDHNAMVESSL